jgi:hypothetical protein
MRKDCIKKQQILGGLKKEKQNVVFIEGHKKPVQEIN